MNKLVLIFLFTQVPILFSQNLKSKNEARYKALKRAIFNLPNDETSRASEESTLDTNQEKEFVSRNLNFQLEKFKYSLTNSRFSTYNSEFSTFNPRFGDNPYKGKTIADPFLEGNSPSSLTSTFKPSLAPNRATFAPHFAFASPSLFSPSFNLNIPSNQNSNIPLQENISNPITFATGTQTNPKSESGDKCIQACAAYAKAIGDDKMIKSVSRSGSTFTLLTHSGYKWAPDRNGQISISSTNLEGGFNKHCSHIFKDEIDPNDLERRYYSFNNAFPADECKKSFASAIKGKAPGKVASPEYVFSDPNADRQLAAEKGVSSNDCSKACSDLVEKYSEGTLAVKGIVSLSDDGNTFAIEAKPNFSWTNNSEETNPDIEAHNDFIKKCSSSASIKNDNANPSYLLVKFKSTDSCQKKFKRHASAPTPKAKVAGNDQDPFSTSLESESDSTRNPAGAPPPQRTAQPVKSDHP